MFLLECKKEGKREVLFIKSCIFTVTLKNPCLIWCLKLYLYIYTISSCCIIQTPCSKSHLKCNVLYFKGFSSTAIVFFNYYHILCSCDLYREVLQMFNNYTYIEKVLVKKKSYTHTTNVSNKGIHLMLFCHYLCNIVNNIYFIYSFGISCLIIKH